MKIDIIMESSNEEYIGQKTKSLDIGWKSDVLGESN